MNIPILNLSNAYIYAKHLSFTILTCMFLVSGNVQASRVSDITHTKHNLSVNGPGDVKVYSGTNPKFKQNQICVFCHTPHGATRELDASGVNSTGAYALWNRKLSTATYQTYTSDSLAADAILKSDPLNAGFSNDQINLLKQPGGSSKLCLSCHDGTLAIGNVNVMWGMGTSDSQWQQIMLGTEYDPIKETVFDGKMPSGGYGSASGVSGVISGNTRNLGTDLRNDHPISVSYTRDLADMNGELRQLDGNQKSVALPPGVYKLGDIIGKRGSGYRPMAPLEPTGKVLGTDSHSREIREGQVQCGACHDPHLRETDPTVGNQKFLRLNRFQEWPPAPVFNFVTDIGCVACHDKNFTTTEGTPGTGTWAYSVHANPKVEASGVPYTYTTSKALQFEFPTTADGAASNLPMWKASCLNCHDTHTVQGARWLLREGTDNPLGPSTPKSGGNSAIEETCYQCHSPSGLSAIEPTISVADIWSDFNIPGGTRMPIVLAEQGNPTAGMSPATEMHSIGGNFSSLSSPSESIDCSATNKKNKCGADQVESRARLGAGGNLQNRHAECTDCHNPHRMVKFQNFLGNPQGSLDGNPDDKGTHVHTNSVIHTNIASGSLRGTFGVEPNYLSNSFAALPSGYTPKHGDPTPGDTIPGPDCSSGANKMNCDVMKFVTREYQICMKCHSDYGYDDNKGVDGNTNRPELGGTGRTPKGTNGLNNYTNQAQEFQAPSTHRGELITMGIDGGAGVGYDSNNHRSWHPVMDSTGRTDTDRGYGNGPNILNPFNPPWNMAGAVGTQTMYCSDCHGSDVASSTSVIPDSLDQTRANWGPHGSLNNFILKGAWTQNTGDGANKSTTAGICFKCHDYNAYALGTTEANTLVTGGTPVSNTGFMIAGSGAPYNNTDVGAGTDGHRLHVERIKGVAGNLNGGRGTRCDWCHTAVPHGFKNKGLLVNLNDIGPEGGISAGGYEVPVSGVTAAYNNAPYYMNARLKVITFKPSGQWTAADCGSNSTAGGGVQVTGLAWMRDSSNENCKTPP